MSSLLTTISATSIPSPVNDTFGVATRTLDFVGHCPWRCVPLYPVGYFLKPVSCPSSLSAYLEKKTVAHSLCPLEADRVPLTAEALPKHP